MKPVVTVDVTTRRESAKLAESLRRLAWMVDGLFERSQALYEGLTPGELQGLDSDVEDVIEAAHELRRLVGGVWEQVSARSDVAA